MFSFVPNPFYAHLNYTRLQTAISIALGMSVLYPQPDMRFLSQVCPHQLRECFSVCVSVAAQATHWPIPTFRNAGAEVKPLCHLTCHHSDRGLLLSAFEMEKELFKK